MKRLLWLVTLACLFPPPGETAAGPLRFCTKRQLDRMNEELRGHLHDFTYNHGEDRRIFSPALGEKRDLFVYTPPGYDGCRPYPLMIWMHGLAQDEKNFYDVVSEFDEAIVRGELPPMVIASPDGSISGRPTFFEAGSFLLNSDAGRFEDYLICDVYGFVRRNFRVRPEREAHVLAGASMGGFSAYNLGIKYRHEFATVAGIFPPLNLRYVDCRGRYRSDYDPECLGMRQRYTPLKPIARFYGVITVRERKLLRPLFGNSPDPVADLARENPYEMLDVYDVRPGELNMFVGYGGRDEFNLDAQIESFVDHARSRGLSVSVCKIPRGRHDYETGRALVPKVTGFLRARLAPYLR